MYFNVDISRTYKNIYKGRRFSFELYLNVFYSCVLIFFALTIEICIQLYTLCMKYVNNGIN